MAKSNPKDVYDGLLEYYVSQRQSVLNLKEAKELVKVRFTEEEARVAMNLPSWYQGGLTSAELADKTGADAADVEELLDRKAREGCFFAREDRETGEVRYSLWDFGRLSAMYDPTRTDDVFMKVQELREKMWKAGGVHNAFPPSGYPLSRVVPYAKGIAEGEAITPTDTVENTTEKTRSIAVAACPCRAVDRRCDKEVMTCIHFDDMADYFVKYQGGRYLTQEECKDFIDKNVADGLVATLANYQSIHYGYCLCDPCCCVILRPLIEENNYHAVEKSNYRPRFDLDQCTRCQKCRNACPVGAIGKLPAALGKPKKEDKMFLFEERCIGCGVCVAQCEFDALKLYRVDDKVPEQTPLDAVKRHAAERMI